MTERHRTMLVAALAATSLAAAQARAQCPGWSTKFGVPSAGNGVDARVYRLTTFDDQSGGGPKLIAGGNFTLCGTATAGGVAAWNGTSWSAVGTGPGLGANGEVYSVHGSYFGITTAGPEIYAGGRFTLIGGTPVNYVSVWDSVGSAWLPLIDSNTSIDGTNDWVFTTLEYVDINSMNFDLVAGGRFTQAGGNAANYISRWDGGASTWSAIGTNTVGGGFDAPVRALASDGFFLYAGGEFSLADSTPASLVAVWDPINVVWSPLGAGLTGALVYDLCFFDPDGVNGSQPNELYAGGHFTFSGSTAVAYVAKWNGTNWVPVGAGFDNVVRDLFVHDSPCGQRLIAVGHFSMSGSTAVNHVAEWDGVSWQPIGAGVGSAGEIALCANQLRAGSAHELFVGGIFTSAASQPSNYIAAACRCPLAPFPVVQGEMAVTTNGWMPNDYVVNLVDLSGTPPPPNTNWFTPKFHNELNPTAASEVWTLANLGQVFGVTFDGLAPPNIYVAATSTYSANTLGPGGAGAVYKLDRLNGDITTFATLPNTGPGLGDVCFDPYHKQFFVSNFEDGKIYRLNSAGTVVQIYDPFAADNGAAGFAPLGERVWAMQVYNSRDLYFSVWLADYGRPIATWPSSWPAWTASAGPNIANNAIFRCTLNGSTGAILTTQPALVEVLPPLPGWSYCNPCSDLRFTPNLRRMLVAERGMYDDEVPYAHEAEVLEYAGGGPGGWSANWALASSQYWTGVLLTNRNACGGGDYDCALRVLATADSMQFGPAILYGVQRIPAGGNTQGLGATSTSDLIDMDGNTQVIDKSENGDCEVYRPNCSQFWLAYCTPKQNSAGCFPSLDASGNASASAGSGFVVRCTQVLGQKAGLLFYGLNGTSENPFQGGTMCAQTPVQRTPVQSSGGNASLCDGVFAIDMNAFAAGALGGSPNPALSLAGTVVDCQQWSRDPASPSTTSLSDAVEYFVGP